MFKVIFVSFLVVEEDEDEDGYIVVVIVWGIFNSNGGVLSFIEIGVSIIIF